MTVCRMVGGQANLARRVTEAGTKVTAQAVYKWIKAGRVPADKAPLVERISNQTVTREALCPDFPWPARQDRPAA